MSITPTIARTGPSLRLEQFAITNFRTFTTRTVIPFRGGTAEPDAIATFHGDNGTGKSNALAALDLFFDSLVKYLSQEEAKSGRDLTLAWHSGGAEEWGLAFRDRPAGAEGPTDLEAHFADERLGVLLVRFTPAGNQVRLHAAFGIKREGDSPPDFSMMLQPADRRDRLLTWIETPFGPGSAPYLGLDSHRRGSVRPGHERTAEGFDVRLAEALFRLRTSFSPQERDRWRTFTQIMQRFVTLRGREVSVDRLTANGAAELTFEERGRSVLALRELSSGEQQLVRLCAATVLLKSSILAIEEPELSLDSTNQGLFKELLREQINAGLRDQVIIESHVPTFDDGPSVIRFSRGAAGETVVTRAPVTDDTNRRDLEERAKGQGAEAQWVTRDGYTQLPAVMRGDLNLANGGHLWFLKGQRAWEAWPEDQLTALLADPEAKKGDE
ncbi:AAA family ATPase [Hyalangium gracile]|uniref:AAA family ATPase n=1 Tax=Hyalangium gracile TaxID=394092 RepID=UPI001CCB9192|nr:AAA family ATPase [Hyalangium gracile]